MSPLHSMSTTSEAQSSRSTPFCSTPCVSRASSSTSWYRTLI
ncbi:hypothetical protein LINPERHAP2_LOCUS44744 [Linum perenne]